MIVSKDWMENVEDTKPLLDPNTLIMASPVAVNSNENTVRNDWKQQVQSSIIGTQNNRSSESPQCARVVLYCQPNSHPFQVSVNNIFVVIHEHSIPSNVFSDAYFASRTKPRSKSR